jgi:hypothetical protein
MDSASHTVAAKRNYRLTFRRLLPHSPSRKFAAKGIIDNGTYFSTLARGTLPDLGQQSIVNIHGNSHLCASAPSEHHCGAS